tara:strand:- start:99 stop:305 length:207 start_codon:yes stop_codon:yes gene_type:complete
MTKADIIKLAREAGLFVHKEVQPELIAFANLVAAAEREEIAKLADASVNADQYPTLTILAQAIRMRGD